jgi:hypothetical protein
MLVPGVVQFVVGGVLGRKQGSAGPEEPADAVARTDVP